MAARLMVSKLLLIRFVSIAYQSEHSVRDTNTIHIVACQRGRSPEKMFDWQSGDHLLITGDEGPQKPSLSVSVIISLDAIFWWNCFYLNSSINAFLFYISNYILNISK